MGFYCGVFWRVFCKDSHGHIQFSFPGAKGVNAVNRLSIYGGPSTFPLPPPYLNRPRAPSDCDDGGMKTCGRFGCLICSYIMETRKFWGPGGVFNIKHYLDCTSRNVVYAIICLKDDTVFIGHTPTDCTLEHIFHTHLLNIQGFNLSDPVAAHFAKPGHSFLDAKVSALAPIKCDQGTRNRIEKILCYDVDKPHHSYHGQNKSFTFL